MRVGDPGRNARTQLHMLMSGVMQSNQVCLSQVFSNQ